MKRTAHILVLGLAGLLEMAGGCGGVDCADGTTEIGGECVPADNVIDPATCGPGTSLQGGQCVSTIICDGETAAGANGETICLGGGGGIDCPAPPSATGITLCGQIFDIESGGPFRASANAKCEPCSPAANGPCSLGIQAVDAIKFANGAQDAPLNAEETVIDDCGQFQLFNVTHLDAIAIGLAIDDGVVQGPGGVTHPTGLALLVGDAKGKAVRNIEHYVAPPDTVTSWSNTGGPTLQTGMFVAVFRANRNGLETQAGVTLQRAGANIAGDDFYFESDEETAETVDPAATATGVNGVALAVSPDAPNVQITKQYTGAGGLPAGCAYSTPQPGVVLPNLVFFSTFRPTAVQGQTCNR